MMKSLTILGAADLHDCVARLDSLPVANVDLIAFCGDLHNGSRKEAARPAAEALSRLGPPVLIVPGNMDHKDVVPGLWKEFGLQMIHCRSYWHGNCGFIGLGGMVARNPARLGDPSRYYNREEDVYSTLAYAYADIADMKFKIVMTHQPPREARDTLYNGESSGSLGLRRFVEEYAPDLVICGHIHEDRGEAWIGPTRVINVGELRQGYAARIELHDSVKVAWIEP
jgi:Icc-related predicted phosphoesterase